MLILDLSFPETLSLNDQVDKHFLEGAAFRLKFPSVNDIVQEIVTHGNDITLAKIDIAREFRNLRTDPAEALKLGIKWGNEAYIDAAVCSDGCVEAGCFNASGTPHVHLVQGW